MNSDYQAMIQQLMGSAYAPPGTNGNLPSTSYGQNFVTGNGMAMQPGAMQPGGMQGQPQQGQGMMAGGPPMQTLQQPMQAYPGGY